MDVTDEDDSSRALTHGFHSWPARFHPLLVRRLIDDLPKKARVLDPFCGSGTTLVEAALSGLAGLGVDLNPLAIALARLKATPWSAARREVLQRASEQVVAAVGAEVRASRRRSSRSPEAKPQTRFDDPHLYPPHVYRELVSLKLAIGAITDEPTREALLLSLSSIVVKVSLQRSDTDPTIVLKAIARGAATRHFARRVEELLGRLSAFSSAIPPGTPQPSLRMADARLLAHIEDASIDRVVTSPPYLGTYDYAQHHERRMGWVGLDSLELRRNEIGARRGEADPAQAFADWAVATSAWVGELARVLKPSASAYVLVGDSRLGGHFITGPDALAKAAAEHGLHVAARASQGRPSGREHLLALRRR